MVITRSWAGLEELKAQGRQHGGGVFAVDWRDWVYSDAKTRGRRPVPWGAHVYRRALPFGQVFRGAGEPVPAWIGNPAAIGWFRDCSGDAVILTDPLDVPCVDCGRATGSRWYAARCARCEPAYRAGLGLAPCRQWALLDLRRRGGFEVRQLWVLGGPGWCPRDTVTGGGPWPGDLPKQTPRPVPPGAMVYKRSARADWEGIRELAELFERRKKVSEVVGVDFLDTPCVRCGGGTGVTGAGSAVCPYCARKRRAL